MPDVSQQHWGMSNNQIRATEPTDLKLADKTA